MTPPPSDVLAAAVAADLGDPEDGYAGDGAAAARGVRARSVVAAVLVVLATVGALLGGWWWLLTGLALTGLVGGGLYHRSLAAVERSTVHAGWCFERGVVLVGPAGPVAAPYAGVRVVRGPDGRARLSVRGVHLDPDGTARLADTWGGRAVAGTSMRVPTAVGPARVAWADGKVTAVLTYAGAPGASRRAAEALAPAIDRLVADVSGDLPVVPEGAPPGHPVQVVVLLAADLDGDAISELTGDLALRPDADRVGVELRLVDRTRLREVEGR